MYTTLRLCPTSIEVQVLSYVISTNILISLKSVGEDMLKDAYEAVQNVEQKEDIFRRYST